MPLKKLLRRLNNVYFSKQKYKVIYQGFTEHGFSFRASSKIRNKLVGGVTPKRWTKHLNLPVFNTVQEAKEKLDMQL